MVGGLVIEDGAGEAADVVETTARRLVARQQTGMGVRGVVAASAPIAGSIGAAVLRRGGNAYDAAIGAAMAETVLLPSKCGLGGDLIALCLEPGEDEPTALLAIGPAPGALADVARDGGLTTTGPTSVGVPAAATGYAALAERGWLTRAQHVEAAIDLATAGIPWTPINVALAAESRALVLEHHPDGTTYHPRRAPLELGTVVRAPGLARVLAAWAENGADLLHGPIGEAIVDRVTAAGGILTADDLRQARATWTPPAVVDVGAHRLWATPAPTHGPSLLAAVSAYADAGHGGAGDLWAATQAAIADRRRRLSDPAADDGTSMVSAVDEAGRVVLVVHSNSFPRYGSGLAVDAFDLVLNNRAGRGFSTDPSSPNFPAPGRRPATTLHAWAIGRGHPELLGATPGGANQMIWNAQTLAAILSGEHDPGTLVTSPRWEWLPEDDGVRVEQDLGAASLDALGRCTDRVEVVEPLTLRSAQQVVRGPTPGQLRVAASDPRTGGAAVGV